MSGDGYSKTQAALVKAVRMLCRPLVKLLIEKGITFPQFRELIKEVYVDVADSQFTLDGKANSDSRIYVLTGIHRKDIKRIRAEIMQEDDSFNSNASLSGELIARWNSMPDYLDGDGRPRALSRTGAGDHAGFEQLVTSVSKDVRPRVILDEWLRLNIVTMKDDHVVLNTSGFVTNKEFNDMAYYLGHNVHDHIASCTNNILQQGEPMLEQSVYYASLTEESANELRDLSRQAGEDLLRSVNDRAIGLYDRDRHGQDADFRIRLGVYWYQDRLDDEKAKHEKANDE